MTADDELWVTVESTSHGLPRWLRRHILRRPEADKRVLDLMDVLPPVPSGRPAGAPPADYDG